MPDVECPRPREASVDYHACVGEFLRELRGVRTQRELSQLLGFSFNQVGKWESGVTHFKWRDLFGLCEALKVPFEQYFREQFWSFSGEFRPSLTAEEIWTQLQGLGAPWVPGGSISQDVLRQRKTLKRWASMEQGPDLVEVFQVLDKVPSMLVSFVSYFVDVEKMPSLAPAYEQFVRAMDLVGRQPLCVFVNAALQLSSYRSLSRHCDEVLAQAIGCSQKEARSTLMLMQSHGLIFFDGKKFHPSVFDFSFSAVRKRKLRILTKFSTQMAADRYPLEPLTKKSPSTSSVRVNALSQKAAGEIMGLVSQFHHQVAQVVERDRGFNKEVVQVVLVHSFSADSG